MKMRMMKTRISKQLTPGRIIALGFAGVILIGTLLLLLPISIQPWGHVRFLDALFTSTSSVCVTGLLTVDIGDNFTVFGRVVIAFLIQIGGLGISSIGVGVMVLTGKRLGLKERSMVREGMNQSTSNGVVRLLKWVLRVTFLFEGAGAALSFIVFIQDFPFWKAVEVSLFHTVASFNNAGMDILGGGTNLAPYRDNILLNAVTCGLIIFGGLGFFVIREVFQKHSFRKLTLHSKVVLFMTALLLVSGTLLFKLTERGNITWLGAFFTSTTARTAGFNTFPLSGFSTAGLFIVVLLMLIGTSPGSTGGGIKTTTAFVLCKSALSTATNRYCQAFRRKIPAEVISKAFFLTMLAGILIGVDVTIICLFDPQFRFVDVLVEVVSAFSTTGLSTGITADLSAVSQCVLIATMYIGRLGPLTVATMWVMKRPPNFHYAEESITIG